MKTLDLLPRQSMPLTELVAYLRTQHCPGTRNLLAEANHHLQVLVKSRLGDGNGLLPLYQQFMSFRDGFFQHLNKEDVLLFPYAVQTCNMPGRAKFEVFQHECMLLGPLRLFRAEHQALLELNRKMQTSLHQILQQLPKSSELDRLAKQLTAVSADLTDHVYVEEDLLFPALLRMENRYKLRQEEQNEALPTPTLPKSIVTQMP